MMRLRQYQYTLDLENIKSDIWTVDSQVLITSCKNPDTLPEKDAHAQVDVQVLAEAALAMHPDDKAYLLEDCHNLVPPDVESMSIVPSESSQLACVQLDSDQAHTVREPQEKVNGSADLLTSTVSQQAWQQVQLHESYQQAKQQQNLHAQVCEHPNQFVQLAAGYVENAAHIEDARSSECLNPLWRRRFLSDNSVVETARPFNMHDVPRGCRSTRQKGPWKAQKPKFKRSAKMPASRVKWPVYHLVDALSFSYKQPIPVFEQTVRITSHGSDSSTESDPESLIYNEEGSTSATSVAMSDYSPSDSPSESENCYIRLCNDLITIYEGAD